MTATQRVFIACDDLFFRVNLEARVRSVNLEPVGVDTLEAVNAALSAGAPRAAFVDLHLRGDQAVPIVERLSNAKPGMPVICFGSHVDQDLLDRARRAGGVALPRSRFVREFPSLLAKLGVGTLTTSLQDPSAPVRPEKPE